MNCGWGMGSKQALLPRSKEGSEKGKNQEELVTVGAEVSG